MLGHWNTITHLPCLVGICTNIKYRVTSNALKKKNNDRFVPDHGNFEYLECHHSQDLGPNGVGWRCV